jgi:hypothetical protein
MRAVRTGDAVISRKKIGGFIREEVPAGTTGEVVKAPWLGPVHVAFRVYDIWHGQRVITVQVQPDEIAAIG